MQTNVLPHLLGKPISAGLIISALLVVVAIQLGVAAAEHVSIQCPVLPARQ